MTKSPIKILNNNIQKGAKCKNCIVRLEEE